MSHFIRRCGVECVVQGTEMVEGTLTDLVVDAEEDSH